MSVKVYSDHGVQVERVEDARGVIYVMSVMATSTSFTISQMEEFQEALWKDVAFPASLSELKKNLEGNKQ